MAKVIYTGALSQRAPPDCPSLIPDGVRDYANRLRQGTLTGQTFPGGFSADDEKMLAFLEAVADGDETEALATLAVTLEGWPLKLWHPYTHSQFMHLFTYCGTWDPPDEIREYITGWLSRLLEAWTRGMTGGYDASVKKPKGLRGQSPLLFPHLGDQDRYGYFWTKRAQDELLLAFDFRDAYDDLMEKLRCSVQWKAVRREYQDLVRDHRDPTALVEQVAADIRPVFESWLKDRKCSGGSSTSDQALQGIVREGLSVRQGGNPRHRIACGLLGQRGFVNGGTSFRTPPSRIESTLKTLRRHGIPPTPTTKRRRKTTPSR